MKAMLFASLLLFVFSSCKGPQGPQGPSGAPGSSGSELLVDPSIMPKVIYMYPAPNSQGPYTDYYLMIQLRFNKIMERESFRRGVSIFSPTTNAWIDTSGIYTLGGDIFSFYVVEPRGENSYNTHLWKVGESYTISVASSAKDINGNFLTAPYSASFKPEPFFRVRDAGPQNGSTSADPLASVYFVLNSPVDTSIFGSLQFVPRPSGSWRLGYNDSTYMSFSHSGLDVSTDYAITLQTTARDKAGNRLRQPHVISFRTAPFRVTNTYPEDGATSVSRGTSVGVYFNSPIDTGSVRANFSIPGITGTYFMSTTMCYFTPTNQFAANTRYTAIIQNGMKTRNGTRLQNPYQFSFTTGGE